MIIREEQPGDLAAIRRVILEAFDGPAEADLVEKLRANGKFRLSLVAELDGQVVGHILFTVVAIEDAAPCPRTLGLAPLAVLSEFQRKGIGSALMHSSLERCREMGHDAIVVVGHPEYYPKFGFLPASQPANRSDNHQNACSCTSCANRSTIRRDRESFPVRERHTSVECRARPCPERENR